jgi:hypothetical protein
MRNDTKRKFGTMFFVAIIVFFGHWWDYFYMIKPGARIAAFEAKEMAEGKHHSAKPHETTISEADTQPKPEVPVSHETTGETASQGHTATVEHATTAAETAHKDTAATHEATAEAAPETHPTGAEASDAQEATADVHPPTHAEVKHDAEHEAIEESKSFKLGYTIPGLDDLGVMIGFLSLFLFFFFNQLSKSSLVPMRDPYLEESLHHDTGALIEGEPGGHDHH